MLLVLCQLCVEVRHPQCFVCRENRYCRYVGLILCCALLRLIVTLTAATHHDSVVTFALPFVTLTPSAFAFARILTRFLDDTACAISAAYVLLCMRSRSTSFGLWTRKARWPEGIMCRVFLFEPKPIYNKAIVSQSVPESELVGDIQSPISSYSRSRGLSNDHHFSARTDGITA
jgi:hypothetical protein